MVHRFLSIFVLLLAMMGSIAAYSQTLPPNGSVNGTLTTTETADTLSIKFTQDGNARFTVTPADTLRVRLAFYDSNGTTRLFYTGDGDFGAGVSLNVPHLGPGATYFN